MIDFFGSQAKVFVLHQFHLFTSSLWYHSFSGPLGNLSWFPSS